MINRQKIESEWVCPSCGEKLLPEECEEIRERLNRESGQIEFRCDSCYESLMADNTHCSNDEIDINEMWIYD